MTRPGKLIVLSGPSGSGKSTVVDRLLERTKWPIRLSVSATTRSPRPDEREAVDYHFLTREAFELARQRGEFLECAEFVGNWYGTPARWVLDQIESGNWVLLEIEVQGGMQVAAKHRDCITIFLKTSSIEEYERRLRQRGTNTEGDIRRRLEQANRELQFANRYHHQVINDDLDSAVETIEIILDQYGGQLSA